LIAVGEQGWRWKQNETEKAKDSASKLPELEEGAWAPQRRG
jgi:hypothetical protein